MTAKRKRSYRQGDGSKNDAGSLSPSQRLAQARQDHAKGAIGTEDFIWAVMQCYAADGRSNDKSSGHFAR